MFPVPIPFPPTLAVPAVGLVPNLGDVAMVIGGDTLGALAVLCWGLIGLGIVRRLSRRPIVKAPPTPQPVPTSDHVREAA